MTLLRWTVRARHDLRANEAFYAEIDEDLAVRLSDAVIERCRWLTDFPRAGPPLRGKLRKFNVRGTPFLIVYWLDGDDLEIVRIHHMRQNWRPR